MVQRPLPASAEKTQLSSGVSLPQDQDQRPFDTPNPDVMFTGPAPPHWALIFMDTGGNVREASNLSSPVFTRRARQDFMAIREVAAQRDRHASLLPTTTSYSFSRSPSDNSRRSGRCKRRRGTTIHEETLDVECMETMSDEADLVALEIGDTNRVAAYYDSAFKRLQQLNCRLLAKSFIKLIEPRKQVKHPYNGGRPPAGAPPGEKGDPEKTKPDWWPQGVIHKEPDHLRKDLRLKLLVHIVQRLLPMGITADKLQEVANDNRRHIKPPEKIGILDELFRVRRLEERYERSEVDGNTVIYVVDHEGAKKKEPESDNEEGESTSLPTPNDSSDEALVENSRSSFDLAGLPQHVSAMDTTSNFQMHSDVSFGSQDRQVHHFQTSQPDIGHQALVSTPLTNSVLTPPANQFTNHSPYASPLHEQMQPPSQPVQSQVNTPAAFAGWSPAFQQNMFANVDYTGNNRHVPSQMAYPAYTVCPAPHAHVVPAPHALPDLNRSQIDMMNMGNLPFRTGSLSHPNVVPPPQGNSRPQL